MQLLQFAKTSDFVKVLNGWLDYVLTVFSFNFVKFLYSVKAVNCYAGALFFPVRNVKKQTFLCQW